jgi:hypothetical protein
MSSVMTHYSKPFLVSAEHRQLVPGPLDISFDTFRNGVGTAAIESYLSYISQIDTQKT